ncbi:lysozyme inhibitor LprI family protein [Microbulbifer sp. SAOS-129_SWC]|uniref:lysozyme inhibitor LprI family protein n=1 Tax=Microbulbifer sp. SAOS-129_SWC TaxID=3145235 RepID=UPI003217EF05
MPRLLLFLLLLLSNTALAASFDCQKADRVVDKIICSNERLSKLDEDMAAYYFKVRDVLQGKASAALVQGQRDWLRQRPRKCPSIDADCLIKLYKYRIVELRREHENRIPYRSSGRNIFSGLEGACGFGRDVIAKNTRVYAGGSYGGKRVGRSIDDSRHKTTQFEVIVNSPDKPVALILGAYEPSVWNISWTRGTKISAVVATGYYRQAVAGLPGNVPILVSSNDSDGPCGYLYIKQRYLKKINRLSGKVFNKDVSMVYYAKNGTLVLGDPIQSNLKLYQSDDTPVETFFDTPAPTVDAKSINDLLMLGLIRKATREDLDAWRERKTKFRDKDLPPVAPGFPIKSSDTISLHNAYVILGQITMPPGLYGGHSVNFFLPEGVPYPKGSLGHSGLFDFSTMTCTGIRCPGGRLIRRPHPRSISLPVTETSRGVKTGNGYGAQ